MTYTTRIPHRLRFQLDFIAFTELRRLLSSRPAPKTAESRFACQLAIHLPEVAAIIDEDDFGVIHLEVGVLAKATSSAIAKNDWNTVQRHFAFVTDMLAKSGKELHDAIEVSYIEYLLLDIRITSLKERPQSLMLVLEDLKQLFDPHKHLSA